MASLRAQSITAAPSLLYEPEITIRRLYSNTCDFRQASDLLLRDPHHLSPHFSPATLSTSSTSRNLVTSPNPELYLNLSKKSPILVVPTGATSSSSKRSSTEYGCSFCTFSCTWRYDLKLHLKQKHGIHKK
jgi:hypothetical protein